MLLQYKVYLIGALYFSGFMFMIIFPSRNYQQSGSKMREVRMTGDDLQFKKYMDYKAVLDVSNRIGLEDPAMAHVVHLTPQTFANNSIIALELHSDVNSKKPGILIIGAIDGMAWGAPNAVMELAEKLLYDTNYQTPFFNDYDWYLIPMANPDAIGFTRALSHLPAVETSAWSYNASLRAQTRPLYWHKNIEMHEHDMCFGTNINRNFAYHWQDDVSKTPLQCSQYYPGAKPFSSAEARAVRAYIDKLDDNVQLVIHLHASFTLKKEYILYPWRYTTRQPSNYKSLQAIGEHAARQARLPDGRLYQVHQASSDGKVAGTLSDYISGVLGIRLVFLLKPYHPPFVNKTDIITLAEMGRYAEISLAHILPLQSDNFGIVFLIGGMWETYVKKSISTILSIVRGWRSSTKQNTLSFFGRDVEF